MSSHQRAVRATAARAGGTARVPAAGRGRWTRLAAAVAAMAMLGGCSGGGGDRADRSAMDGTVTVFAAASLTDALTEVARAFEAAHPGATVELNLAGSQALREQILAGAPADVFAPAAAAEMDSVVREGEVVGEPRVFARTTLEIVVPAGNPAAVDGLADFADDDLLLGLCAVEVPCGALARQALDRAGVSPRPDTEEPDVRSLLGKVAAGELDAGIVYRPDVLAGGAAVEGIPIADDVNVVTDYSVAALARAPDPALADAFVDFLVSGDGRAIVTSFGFGAP
jgi:molybdate transport system substrate-binding protein